MWLSVADSNVVDSNVAESSVVDCGRQPFPHNTFLLHNCPPPATAIITPTNAHLQGRNTNANTNTNTNVSIDTDTTDEQKYQTHISESDRPQQFHIIECKKYNKKSGLNF